MSILASLFLKKFSHSPRLSNQFKITATLKQTKTLMSKVNSAIIMGK